MEEKFEIPKTDTRYWKLNIAFLKVIFSAFQKPRKVIFSAFQKLRNLICLQPRSFIEEHSSEHKSTIYD